jgi:hypothetical protein
MSELLVIVPSRGRPESVARVAEAWRATGAYDCARLVFAIDADDPRHADYYTCDLPDIGVPQVYFYVLPAWKPMVAKLNECAVAAVNVPNWQWQGVAFMGDDHLPRTPGWAAAYLEALRELGTGIVYGDDGIQGQRLPTQWAMTSDIIRALGRMVPADVEHLYCDNAIKDLGDLAGCLRYLPDVLIEHMHPVAGKASMDAGYERVNRREQYRKDRLAYELWKQVDLGIHAGVVRTIRDRAEADRG